MKGSVKLFVDDERFPHDVVMLPSGEKLKDTDFIVVRDYLKAEACIENYKPQYIAFDHDLGNRIITKDGKALTGKDLANQLVKLDLALPKSGFITRDFKFSVHSANPVGQENIKKLILPYFKAKFPDAPSPYVETTAYALTVNIPDTSDDNINNTASGAGV